MREGGPRELGRRERGAAQGAGIARRCERGVVRVHDLLLNGLNGVSYGLVLFLVAAGLSVSLGLLKTLNLAHGAMYMVGGYFAWSLVERFHVNYWLAIVISGLAILLLGVVLEAGCLRWLGQSLDAQILATFGVLTALANVTAWIWTTVPKAPLTPPGLGGSVKVASVHYPLIRLVDIGLALGFAVGIWFLQRSRLGAMVKAAVDEREVAAALGLRVRRVGSMVFAAGAFLAGASGAIGLTQRGLNNDLGTTILTLALIVIVFGGMGSLLGALIGALVLGLVTAFGASAFPNYVALAPYGVMIVVLVIRPEGLFGRQEIRAG